MATEETPVEKSSKPPSRWATRADAAVAIALAVALAVLVILTVIHRNQAGRNVRVIPGDKAAWLVNVNTAETPELMLLPGIGKVRAGKILAWRRAHGPFTSLEDVRRATGLSKAEFDEIRPALTLGPSSVPAPPMGDKSVR